MYNFCLIFVILFLIITVYILYIFHRKNAKHVTFVEDEKVDVDVDVVLQQEIPKIKLETKPIWASNNYDRQFVNIYNNDNDQTKFAEWLYKKDYVCKSGSIYNEYGYSITPDSLVCTGNNAAVPENGGQLE